MQTIKSAATLFPGRGAFVGRRGNPPGNDRCFLPEHGCDNHHLSGTEISLLTLYAMGRTLLSDAGRTDRIGGYVMSEKLTVRWEDTRIETMALRGMKEENFDTLSDYVRAAIIRDRFLAGDKDASAIVKENIGKWFRGELKPRRVKIEFA